MPIKYNQYSQTTHSVTVKVNVSYLGEQNITNDYGCYIWVYSVSILNKNNYSIKLLNNFWEITDNKGIIEKTNGIGVVGEQPTLAPQEMFEYTSGTYLHTISGIMNGYYEFLDEQAKIVFKVVIPTASLDSPYCYIRPN